MERRYDYIKNLFGLLKKEKFSFDQDAQNYLALGCHVNSGGSDKGQSVRCNYDVYHESTTH